MKSMFQKTAAVVCIIAATVLLTALVSAAALRGDLDGNGQVDANDAIYLLMHTFFEDDYPITQNADFDKSGKVDANDAIYLLMNTFFPKDYPLACEHEYKNGICTLCGENQPSTSDEYFIFIELPDGTYSVKAKDVNNMPAEVVIPSTYNGKAVTSIGDGAFSGCVAINSVVIPAGMTSIGNGAFNGCSSLIAVVIPADLISIGNDAFNNCSKFTNINYVGTEQQWQNITIGSNNAPLKVVTPDYNCNCAHVEVIDAAVAPTCTKTGLTEGKHCSVCGEILVAQTPIDMIAHTEVIDAAVAPTCTKTGLTEGKHCSVCGEVTVKQETVAKAKHTYQNGTCSVCGTKVTPNEYFTFTELSDGTYSVEAKNKNNMPSEVIIPSEYNGKAVTSIGYAAFYGCTSLASITIPDSVTSIGGSAFYGCTSLTEIYYNATECSDLSPNNRVFYNAGRSSDGIKVVIGANVKKIPACLFYPYSSSWYAPQIVSVEFAEGSVCESIGKYAFSNCTSLTSVTIPDSVTSIGDDAFGRCTSLASITIPDSVTSIGGSAFSGCRLTSVIIPASVTSIGNYAFSGCTSLTEIYYNATECADLSSSNHVFSNAGKSGDGIKVIIGANVKKIPAYLFYPYVSHAPKIISVEFARGSVCESIGNHAFDGCASLTSVTIPDSVTRIGGSVFSGCTSLTSVTIPDSVTSIGNYAFSGCTSLTEIYYNATECADLSSSNYVFSNAGKSGDGIKVIIGANVKKIPAYLFYPYSSYAPKIVSVEFAEGSVCESIGKYAFSNCTSLTTIIIPDSVTSIGDYAFRNCSSLTSVTIPDSVTSIDSAAFGDCLNLKSIYISDLEAWCKISFKSISSTPVCYDLYLNNNLVTELILSDSILSIGQCTFSGCTSLTSITIPDSVTSIGGYAFYNCTSLASVTIPDSVTSIGNYAFKGCTNLTSVTIPDSVTSIGSFAFYNCTSLASVTIPDSVTSIGQSAFEDCTSLASVTIGSSVTSIGYSAFYNCTGLTEIYYNATECSDLSASNHVFAYAGKSNDGIKVIIGANVKKIPAYLFCPYDDINLSLSYSPKIVSVEFVEGSVCESIGKDAFRYCTKLKSVYIFDIEAWCKIGFKNVYSTPMSCGADIYLYNNLVTELIIPSSVTSVGDYSFYAFRYLTSVTIPDSVTSIGNDAFSDCYRLTSVTIGNGVTSVGEYAFYKCTSLTSVTIPNGVMSIGDCAFSGCTSLTSVTIPDSVTSIGDCAFSSCTSLTSVTIPDSVTSIGCYAFKNCTSLMSATIGNSVMSIDEDAFYNCISLTSVTIPDSVTSIGQSAFSHCTSLANITIGSGVTSIGGGAFSDCTNLIEIYYNATECTNLGENQYAFYNAGQLGDGIKVVIGANVKKIPAYLFYPYNYDINSSLSYSPKIVSVEFAEGSMCESIGHYAFNSCTSLTSITIPDSVTRIGSSAFSGCTSLTSVTIGSSVTSIDYEAFKDCTSLTSITIPDSVTSIGSFVFERCTNLMSATIGGDVTSIGDCAFRGCFKLVEVINHSKLNIVAGDYSNGEIGYYAKEVHTDYSKINNVNEYLFYTYDGGNYLLGYLGNNTELVLPDNYNGQSYEIYKYAFYNCNGLTSVTIGNSVTSIGSSAFEDCTNLASVTIGNSVTSISYEVFRGCTSLTSVTIPDSVTSIGGSAFSGCTSLTSATIGNSVTSIGRSAFYNCTSLAEIYYNATECADLESNNNVFYNAGKSSEGIKVIIGANVKKIPAALFCPNYHSSLSGPPKIVSVEFEEGSVCESIGDYAFYDCSFLKSITIPDSVTSIGNDAFNDCRSLKSVYISNIEAWCKIGFKNVYSTPMSCGADIYLNNNLVTELIIPSSVTSVGDYSFYTFKYLTSVTIPDSVTSIGDSAFRGCTSLTEIYYNATECADLSSRNHVFSYAGYSSGGIKVIIGANVKRIPAWLFYPYESHAPKIVSVEFAEGSVCESIGNHAFYGCARLTSVTIPNSVTSIGDYAFSHCTSLTSVTIPDSVTSIGNDAFSHCTSLTSVTIGNSVTSIGDYAFYNCTSLANITIPDSVTSIGYSMFYGCKKLQDVYYTGTEEQWKKISIASSNDPLKNATIHYNYKK